MAKWLARNWLALLGPIFFILLTAAGLWGSLSDLLVKQPRYLAEFNTMASIGTSGAASYIFYYIVNARLDRSRRRMIKRSLESTYAHAKRSLAYAVIHASQKGGRRDLVADNATADKMLDPKGFTSLFSGGREADEGYYAFENEMSSKTPEYDEIILNLRVMAKAADRLIASDVVSNEETYDLFVRISSLVDRIERTGPGYDESKPLCGLIWTIFSGWSFIDGDLGGDPIQHAIARL